MPYGRTEQRMPCTRRAVGRYGFAFRFDGDDQLMISDAPGLDADTLTALCWVKPSTFDFDADAGIIFNKEGSCERKYSFLAVLRCHKVMLLP